MQKKTHTSFSFFFLLAVLTLFLVPTTLAQENDTLTPDVRILFAKAKKQQQQGNHTLANESFRKLIDMHKRLPQEFAYFFSLTLYHTNQYQNAYNFVDKYLTMLGRKANYYQEALTLKTEVSAEIGKIHDCLLCDNFGYRYTTCYQCNGDGRQITTCYRCRGVGTIVCPKCKGQGILITSNYFHIDEYTTCPVCHLNRRITCPICDGKKKLEGNCTVCLGSGKIATKQICNHLAVLTAPHLNHDHDHNH